MKKRNNKKAKQRYQDFLRAKDTYPDITFKQYLTHSFFCKKEKRIWTTVK